MNQPKLSVIIPAYNEARYIGKTLELATQALQAVDGLTWEMIVADDDSTDETAAIASQHGAHVVRSGKRNIGGTRNVGAAAAAGECLLFLDADTHICADNIRELLAALKDGRIGGGACVDWFEPTVGIVVFLSRLWNLYSRLSKSPAGSFFFVKRDCFEQVKGFDEEYYISEELYLGKKLRRIGKLAIIPTPIKSSPRKAKDFTRREHFGFFLRMLFAPRRITQSREGLDIWYTRRHGAPRDPSEPT